MKRLGLYILISIGVLVIFNAGFNSIIAYSLDVVSLLISIVINALMGTWGVWLVRYGWRELNKIEGMKVK